MADGAKAGAAAGSSSPVLRTEVSVLKVAFSTSVKTLVRALEDSHGSGGWYVMAITVNISTEKTKTEKHTLLTSFMMFCPIGSVELNSLILVQNPNSSKPRLPKDLNFFKRNLVNNWKTVSRSNKSFEKCSFQNGKCV